MDWRVWIGDLEGGDFGSCVGGKLDFFRFPEAAPIFSKKKSFSGGSRLAGDQKKLQHRTGKMGVRSAMTGAMDAFIVLLIPGMVAVMLTDLSPPPSSAGPARH